MSGDEQDTESRAPKGARRARKGKRKGKGAAARRARGGWSVARAGEELRLAARLAWRAMARFVARLGPRLRKLSPRARRRAALGAACSLAVLLAACYVAAPQRPATPPRATATKGEPRVRVALVEAAAVVSFTLPGAATLEADQDQGALPSSASGPVEVRPGASGGLEVRVGERSVSLPGASEVRFLTLAPPVATGARPERGVVEVDGRRYHGDVVVRRLKDGRLRLVNSVGVEDYLAGVIGHEMPLSWSDTALHAQAVAARTYALFHRHPDQDHDLKADTRSQVYRGVMAEDARARAMVDATRGMVLTWKGEIFQTYFHSTCGGETVPAHWIFGGTESIAPLMGATACPCTPSRYYRWEQAVDLTTHAGARKLVLELPLDAVDVELFPRGGYVKKVELVDKGGARTPATAAEVRGAFGLRSYAFTCALDETRTKLLFSGRGWGHGVGLCQWGAQGCSKAGMDGPAILARYYPGSKLESLGY